ncbi:hypothetical protein CACET_c25420 [Clostridium aceticum]|uniref:Uncharacterized protein n=1 Tax=Clostridium aceticum TaxID=84022 RepID=A0A0G3WDL3_9CLOT|nr:hypothetical protein CACET_c25420 [Clostridium aceticum]
MPASIGKVFYMYVISIFIIGVLSWNIEIRIKEWRYARNYFNSITTVGLCANLYP